MKVRARSRSDYTFEIESFEWSAIKDTDFGAAILGNGATISTNGATFGIYNEVPERMIRGEVFRDVESPKTRAIISKTDFLTDLGFCVWVRTGEIVPTENIKQRSDFEIQADHYRFVCNHIPQIFYPSVLGVIVGIDGEYDFNIGLFKGSLIFE